MGFEGYFDVKLRPHDISPSGHQLLSDSLCYRLSPIANTEFSLHLLEVAADRLLTKPRNLGDLVGSPSQRHQPHYGKSIICSRRNAAKLAAAKRMMRIGCVRMVERTLGDQ
jgi:hypothetical protein